ncbi:MAG: HNH endonuclease [Ruminococcus sp.]|nr:HNH endonuclease [Candidatus Copronaster equi]
MLKKYHFECQECKKNGKVVTAKVVHHKKHLRKFPELAFDDDNLEPVCADCHNKLHPEKIKIKNKKKWNDEKW